MVEGVKRLACLLLTLTLGLGCASIEGHRAFEAGNHALDRGDTQQAISAFERAATLVPEASEVQNHLGIAYTSAGRDEEALAAFERAVALDCDNQAAAANLEAARGRVSLDGERGRGSAGPTAAQGPARR
jgi:tetratricopeptide (TPR) repeat protein